MRTSVHDSIFRFRVSGELIHAVEAKARSEGVTASELIRQAIARELRDAA